MIDYAIKIHYINVTNNHFLHHTDAQLALVVSLTDGHHRAYIDITIQYTDYHMQTARKTLARGHPEPSGGPFMRQPSPLAPIVLARRLWVPVGRVG